MNTVHSFLFNVFPYLCGGVFLMGSLARFDRDQTIRQLVDVMDHLEVLR